MMTTSRTCVLAALSLATTLASAQWSVRALNDGASQDSAAYGVRNGVIVGSVRDNGGVRRGAVWTSVGATNVTVGPSGSGGDTSSLIFSTDGNRHYGIMRTDGYYAGQWTGTNATATSIHQLYEESNAYFTDGTQVVGRSMGFVGWGVLTYATVWNASTLTATNLGIGIGYSEALGVHNNYQVGWLSDGFRRRAAIWNGTADSVQLLDTQERETLANAIWENTIVGTVQGTAVAWTGASRSLVFIPTGGIDSEAVAVHKHFIAGNRTVGGRLNAAGWYLPNFGFVDLHSVASSRYIITAAKSVHVSSAEIVVVGYGETAAGTRDALVWTLSVPEPASMLALGTALVALCRKKKRSKA